VIGGEKKEGEKKVKKRKKKGKRSPPPARAVAIPFSPYGKERGKKEEREREKKYHGRKKN